MISFNQNLSINYIMVSGFSFDMRRGAQGVISFSIYSGLPNGKCVSD